MKIAFVVQRYGTEILGGSEYHCRLIAERLADRHQVDVLTTCARDYITWANEYPEGADRVRGVTVRRFATARTRDIEAFNKYSDWIFHSQHSRHDEMEWLKQQGPWSPGLLEYIERHHGNYDILIFFTYLYATTALGIQIAPSKSLLVPTAHDEPALGLDIYKDVFASAAGLVWNTEVERRFVTSRFHLRALAEDVVGCGVDLPEGEAVDAPDRTGLAPTSRETLASHLEGAANVFRRRHRMHDPFVLYGGRIDPGKGCEELFEYFQTYLKEGGDITLMLMGAKLMPLPDDPRVRFAGLLPDEERLHALEAASVVIVPSPYESLSLLALEAFAVGTPVLANARSEVLVDHCLRSNAGLFYADRWEFVEALKLLMRDAELRTEMGHNGRTYVNRHYRWTTILGKYERLFTRLRGQSDEDKERPRFQMRDRSQDRPPQGDREQRRPDRNRDGRDARGRGDRPGGRDGRDSRDRGRGDRGGRGRRQGR
jgi:glycosyltransferase involved in cell wall biosynthesis